MRMIAFGIPIRSCSEGTALKWKDPEYIEKQQFTDERKQNHKKAWTKKRRRVFSKRLRKWWRDPFYRKRNLAHLRRGFREWYADPENRRYGEKHPNWRGGPRPYPREWTEAFKEMIRERDGHICAICAVGQKDQAHDVHHINYDRDDVREGNCITLCHSCHMVTNGKRDVWKAILYEVSEQRGF